MSKELVTSLWPRLARQLLPLALTIAGPLAGWTSSAPQFGTPTLVSSSHRAEHLAMGDFDGDNIPDVAVLDGQTGDVQVFFGDGAGGFRATSASFKVSSSNGLYRSLAAADLDGDGKFELLFAASDAVLIYRRQGDGSFTNTSINLASTFIDATKIAVGDLTAAGSRDIVVSDDDGAVGLIWIPNNGQGTFGSPTAYATSGTAIESALVLQDIDGDGLADVVFANRASPATVSLFLNQGDHTLAAEAKYGTPTIAGFSTKAVAVADADGDGKPDVVALGRTSADVWYLSVHVNNGNDTLADGVAFPYQMNGGTGVVFTPAIDTADFNNDGRADFVTLTDFFGNSSNPNPFHGFTISRFTGTGANLTMETQTDISSGTTQYHCLASGYRNAAGDFVSFDNHTLPDVLIGTSSIFTDPNLHSQFAVFTNTLPSIPPGRDLQFDRSSLTVAEGHDLEVTLTRGSDSTGQVLAFFTTGGTAVRGTAKDKGADYDITDPIEGIPVTFAEGEFQQTITLTAFATKGAESRQTVVLTLLEPVGDCQLGAQNTTTITIDDDQDAVIPKPGALIIKTANPVKPVPANVKAAARTGSDWTFSVSQKLPVDAYHPSVKVQSSIDGQNWVDYLALTQGKGTSWSAVDRHPLICSHLLFRTLTSADGYPDVAGNPSVAYAVIGGPELALNVSVASDSDASGDTVHTNEAITYHFTAANVSNDTAANGAVLTVPIPKHASFLTATGPHTETTVAGVTTVTWNFTSIAQASSQQVDLVVQVDTAGMFSSKEQKTYLNGNGYFVTLAKYGLSAPAQGIKASPILHEDYNPVARLKTTDCLTQIIGSLKLTVSTSPSTVDPGGLITYIFHCQNESADPLSGAIVLDTIPKGTVLDTVYAFDGNGDAKTTPLPNPGALTNPALVYAKTDTTAKIDLSNFLVQELALLAPIAKAKPGRIVNLGNLSADTIKLLIDDGFIEPVAVRWVMGTIPGKGTAGQSNIRDVALTVRVPYDRPAVDASGKPVTIVNNDYDFIVPGDNPPATAISALYKSAATPLTVAVNNVAPATKPHLLLSKSAVATGALNNSAYHGNGHATVPGIGDVPTVFEHNGLDYQLAYRNDNSDGTGADAHGVVLHDVIPQGMTLRGYFTQDVNGTGFGPMTAGQFTFYDQNGAIIPGVDPSTNQNNMALVRSLDIRLGEVSNLTTLAKGSFGTVRYTCEPSITSTSVVSYPGVKLTDYYALPGVVHSFGGFTAGQGTSGKLQGFYLTTSDQLQPEPGSPKDCVVRVISNVSWDAPAPTLCVNDSQPYDIVPFDFPLSQNGDATAFGTVLKFTVPTGATLIDSAQYIPHANAVVTEGKSKHTVANGTDSYNLVTHLVPLDPAKESETVPGSVPQSILSDNSRTVEVQLGDIAGHSQFTVRVFFELNGPLLDPAIKAAGYRYGPLNRQLRWNGGTQAAREGAPVALTGQTQQTTAASDTAATNQMKAHELNPPRLGIVRDHPSAVQKGSTFTYTIRVKNAGDVDATNVDVGMQVPFRTYLPVGERPTNGIIFTPNLGTGAIKPEVNPNSCATTTRTNKGVIHDSGAGIDIVTWHFDKVPAKGSIAVDLTVHCFPTFADAPIQDHSAYVNAGNAGTIHAAADPVVTWIYGGSLDDSKIQAAEAFLTNQGITITPELIPVMADVAKAIGTRTKVREFGGLDVLHLVGVGVKIIPLGKDQVFIISNDGASVVAQGAGNIISNDGASIVAQGAGNAISVKNLSSSDSSISGTHDCAYLLDHAQAIVAAGAGNIVAAGAGNLVTDNGSGLISNHPGGGIIANISQFAGSAIQADGSRIISNDGGSIIGPGSPLLSENGIGVVSNDGNSIISNDGASIISTDGSSAISPNGAGLSTISRGGNLIGEHGAGIKPN